MYGRFLPAAALCLLPVGYASGQQVTVTGCAKAGVEAGCWVLSSKGKTYNITAAKPKPRPNTWGTVKGQISNNPTTCMQGTLLSPATWRETRRRC